MNYLISCQVDIMKAPLELSFHVVAPNLEAAKSAARARFLTSIVPRGGDVPDFVRWCGVVSARHIELKGGVDYPSKDTHTAYLPGLV